jgi:hypothetical protein
MTNNKYAISKFGSVLQVQELYQGKTNYCHHENYFPTEWDIFHSESHWSTFKMMQKSG